MKEATLFCLGCGREAPGLVTDDEHTEKPVPSWCGEYACVEKRVNMERVAYAVGVAHSTKWGWVLGKKGDQQ